MKEKTRTGSEHRRVKGQSRNNFTEEENEEGSERDNKETGLPGT